MAELTLRGTKGSPLTHVELDANFVALDSDIRAGSFDSGLEIGDGGMIIIGGDLNLQQGDLTLQAGDIHYNPKLAFHDLVSDTERARFDSTGSFLIGSKVNSQSVKLKTAGPGNQTVLFGNSTSNSGQTTFVQLGAAGTGTHKSGGIKATQMSADFEDWKISLVSYNGTSYVDALDINANGSVDLRTEVNFHDSATFNNGLSVTGDLDIDGTITIGGGTPIATGTVEQVGLTAPTGFTVGNSPITTTGNLILGFASGYSLVDSADRVTWNTALQDAPSDGEEYVRKDGAWEIASGEAYTAGEGLQLIGEEFSLDGEYLDSYRVQDRLSVIGTDMTGLGNSHIYFVDANGQDRAIMFHQPTSNWGAPSKAWVDGKGFFAIQMLDSDGNRQDMINGHHSNWTKVNYAGQNRMTTAPGGILVEGTVGTTRMSLSTDSVADSGQYTPMITAVDLGRAFRRLLQSVQLATTYHELQDHLDSALNEMQATYQSYAGSFDSTDSIGSPGIY